MKSFTLCLTLLLALVNAKSISDKSTSSTETCWSKVALGIDCCPEGTKANYFDEYGDWYKKDLKSKERTCGIIDGYCWSIAKDENGSNYPCCVEEHDPSTYYKDYEGDWSKENKQWCAIRHSNKPWNDRELIEETKDEWNDFKKVWEKERYNFERMSVFVGDNESKINFAWYSKENTKPLIRISKNKDMSDAETYEGTSEAQTDIKMIDKSKKLFEKVKELKINGEKYYTNRVTVKNIKRNTTYYYQRYMYGKWEPTIKYKTYDDKNFKFIFVGDPQIGGGRHRYRPYPQFLHPTTLDEGNRNDCFNWNRAINSAFKLAKTPSVLLSAGDQADEMGDYTQITNQESQYSAFLYPSYLKQIVMATSVGNHEVFTNGFGRHFNVPNPLTNSTITRDFDGWYTGYNYFFKYNNVLVVVLETNDNTESDYRITVRNAIMKYPNTDWRIALFHHDIFGNGNTHSQSDAKDKRGVIFNVLSKYKFDLVINGHDHVYTSSKFISYDNIQTENANSPENYKPTSIKKNVVNKNPNGTFFITANCSSGSKYMDFYKDPNQNYVNKFNQTFSPTFGILDFSQSNGKVRLSVTTYEVETHNIVDGSYIIEKDVNTNGEECWAEKERGLSCCPSGTPPTNKENGRLYGYYRNNHCGIVDVELLPEDKCWAKKFGKDCCVLSDTVMKRKDKNGKWGEEFGEECGIVKDDNEKSQNAVDDCFALKLGFKCCSNANADVVYIDDDGKWSIENNDWCGIPEQVPVSQAASVCFAEKLGYKCCSDQNADVIYTDDDGKWGVENGVWCGLIENGSNNKGQSPFKRKAAIALDPIYSNAVDEPGPIDPSKVPDAVTDCWSVKLGYDCCTNPNAKEYWSDSNGKWGYENDSWCGILEEKPAECWAEKLGFNCCSDPNTVGFSKDDNGVWAVENGDWCGVLDPNNYCWAAKYDYKCCSDPNAEVYSTNGGLWSIENGDWCGITKDGSNPAASNQTSKSKSS